MAVAAIEERRASGRMAAASTWISARGWQTAALLGVLALAAGLNLAGINHQGYGNTYYAAAVKSMLTGWHAFFFASFDAGGFVTVDKPPVGLWVQTATARLFGFSGPSLFLPQAVAGVLSVALLYLLVRRAYGAVAGLLAALVLAVMPISVVVSRNNTMDGLLIFVLLLAVWAVSRAAETGQLRPLLLAAVLVGIGFNIKMLQAYLVLPALWAAYLIWAPVGPWTRLRRLTLASIVLLAVSFAWVAAVDLIPAGSRPYVGSSGTNSALSLVLGYNGLGRVTEALASHIPLVQFLNVTVDLTVAPGFAPGIGDAGPWRLFNGVVAAQASWLLPLALIGLGMASWRAYRPDADAAAPDTARRRRIAVVIWGGWLLACAAYFSVSRFFHLYYLVMLAPPIAALAAIGLPLLWRAYRSGGWAAWLLPVALAVSAALQLRVLGGYPDWRSWLAPAIGAPMLAAIILTAARFRPGRAPSVVVGVVMLAVLGLLAAPTAWAVVSVRDGSGGAWLPQAGPSPSRSFAAARPQFGGNGRAGPRDGRGGMPAFDGTGAMPRPGNQAMPAVRGGMGAMTFAGEQWNSLDPALVAYLVAHQGDAEYLVATATSSYASLFMLATDQPAMALGGYQGWDRIVTPEQLAQLVAGGTVRFFYLGAVSGGGFGGEDATADLVAWVVANCAVVPSELVQSSAAGAAPPNGGRAGMQQLYDCAIPQA